MSQILAGWLNKEVKLSKAVNPLEFDVVFRNGFLFGELLYRLKLEENFKQTFKNLNSNEAAIRNFALLESCLQKKLNINLTSNTAIDIITAKIGSAARLIHLIKSSLSKAQIQAFELDRQNALLELPPLLSRTDSTASYLGSAMDDLLPLIPKFTYENPAKKQYNELQHRFFAELLRSKLKRGDLLSQPIPSVRPRRQEAAKLKDGLNQSRSLSPIRKAQQIPLWDDPLPPRILTPPLNGEKLVLLNLDATKDHIRQRLTSQKNMTSRNKKAVIDNLLSNLKEFESKIHAEIDNLANSDEDIASPALAGHSVDTGEIKQFLAVKATMDLIAHVKLLQALLPSTANAEKNALAQLHRIKIKKIEQTKSTMERELQRKKLLLGEKHARIRQDEERHEQLLLEKVSNLSKQERRIAEQLMEIRHEKEKMRENRIFREQQYNERRKQDYEESLDRELQLHVKSKAEYRIQTDMQLDQHRNILAAKAVEKHAKAVAFCFALLEQITSLALKHSEYRHLNDYSEVPKKISRQWKTLLLQDCPVDSKIIIDIHQDEIKDYSDDACIYSNFPPALENNHTSIQSIRVLDEQEFQEYLLGHGDWAYPENMYGLIFYFCRRVKVPQVLAPLSKLVDSIFELIDVVKPSQEILHLPSVPLKIAIIGKPFAGKNSIAKEINVKFGLHLICIDQLIEDAISKANKSSANLESGEQITLAESALPTCAQIGAQIQLAMMEAQAQLLEKELSGYEDPKPVKLGHLKRATKDKAPTAGATFSARKRSLIVPLECKAESKSSFAKSGLDLVIMLEIDNECAIKRAVGRKQDALTKEKYHMEFKSPPINAPGTNERLSGPIDDGNTIEQLQCQLATYDEQEDLLKDWFSRFGNLNVIDATLSVEKSMPNVAQLLQEFIIRKESEEKEKSCESEASLSLSIPALNDVKKADESPSGSQYLISKDDNAVEGAEKKAASIIDDKKIKAAKNARGASSNKLNRALSQEKLKGLFRIILLVDFKTKPMASAGEPADPIVIEQFVLPRVASVDGDKFPTREIAEILADRWSSIESTYTDLIKFSFRCLRSEREQSIRFFYTTKSNFTSFLERPDRKQELVEAFQAEYNCIEDDLRSDLDAKAELHQRAEDLRDKLWELSDSRREEADRERAQIVENRWVEDHSVILANIFLTAIQAETDCFYATRQLVADYYRDSYSLILQEPFKAAPKLQLLSSNAAAAPIDIVSVVLSSVVPENINPKHSRNMLSSSGGANGALSSTQNMRNKSPATASGIVKKPATTKSHLASANPSAIFERDHSNTINTEIVNFYEFQEAIDLVISGIAIPDDPAQEMNKSTRKRNQATESNIDQEIEVQSPYKQILGNIEQVLRWRLDRINQIACAHLRELRTKGIDTYMALDDCISVRFVSEMDSIREFMNVIKDAVENEARLPNSLTLDGEKFKIDFDALTFEPRVEIRPESPVEKHQSPEKFTVLQILNLSRQFQQLAPDGFISVKDLVESIQRLTILGQAIEALPEVFIAAESLQIQQWCSPLDPYDTGFLNWRRFLMILAKILPTPSVENIVYLKNQYSGCDSFADGLVSHDDFMTVELWFESEHDESLERKFNRSLKMKQALFHIFAVWNMHDNTQKESKSDNEYLDQTFTRNGQSDEFNDGTKETAIVDRQTQNIALTATNFVGAGAAFLGEHDKITINTDMKFDVKAFLMMCTLEEPPKTGLQKAFAVASEREDRALDANGVFSICNAWTYMVPESHRDSELPAIFSLELIFKIFQELGLCKEDFCTYECFSQANEAQVILQSPMFLIEEMIFPTNKSRPASSGGVQ